MEEILRCIIGKAKAWDLKPDFKVAVGPTQVCAGHQAGTETAIHSVCYSFYKKNILMEFW